MTGEEFKMFMDFLRSLSLFGRNAPVERVQELVEIIEGQADLDTQFNVSTHPHQKKIKNEEKEKGENWEPVMVYVLYAFSHL